MQKRNFKFVQNKTIKITISKFPRLFWKTVEETFKCNRYNVVFFFFGAVGMVFVSPSFRVIKWIIGELLAQQNLDSSNNCLIFPSLWQPRTLPHCFTVNFDELVISRTSVCHPSEIEFHDKKKKIKIKRLVYFEIIFAPPSSSIKCSSS